MLLPIMYEIVVVLFKFEAYIFYRRVINSVVQFKRVFLKVVDFSSRFHAFAGVWPVDIFPLVFHKSQTEGLLRPPHID